MNRAIPVHVHIVYRTIPLNVESCNMIFCFQKFHGRKCLIVRLKLNLKSKIIYLYIHGLNIALMSKL